MKATTPQPSSSPSVAIIGGGPAGLMAAEEISRAGFSVAVYDAMPSVGRKFLLAGVGGMNITHAEDNTLFLTRYGAAANKLAPFIHQFDAQALRSWAQSLGIETFVGSSQRVFPIEMKAAPLLRAWLHRLRAQGVQFFPRHHWLGWNDAGALRFAIGSSTTDTLSEIQVQADATVLALGGASWARLGSDGAWVSLLQTRGVDVAKLQASNCGFDIEWSEFFRGQNAGKPLNTVTLSTQDVYGHTHTLRGECTISRYGIEGNAIYALSSCLREQINQCRHAQLFLDLLPDRNCASILTALQQPRGKNSWSNFLRKQLKLTPVKIGLLKEVLSAENFHNLEHLTNTIKHLPLQLTKPRPINEAISTAGGVCFSALNQQLMLQQLPGVFCAGEMLDWEAPTGGYLLTACFATGKAAGAGVVAWLEKS